MLPEIQIIGGGLAGCEAALQLAEKGWNVTLFEMRPLVSTPAHHTKYLAEVVCSNSLKSKLPETASGLLKQEMKLLGCKLLEIAELHAVPAGNALAINRDEFAADVTHRLETHPHVTIIRKEVISIPETDVIIATGPLTSEALTSALLHEIGESQLYFFDAIAPIISADSLDMDILFSRTRYDKGEADYLNCALEKDEYLQFVEALQTAEKHEAHEFENRFFQDIKYKFYENCMPIEEIARRGVDTLRFGVMRPVGLENPHTGKRPYAVLQLRSENKDASAYNLVGCQTMMKYGEQKRVFRMLPGFANAEFLRYGSIHRNTYLNGPAVLNPDLTLQKNPKIRIAGQLAGVEGYVESILCGLLQALILSENLPLLPETTISGQLWRHMTITKEAAFQPMNANFGILPEIHLAKKNKTLKKQMYADRSLTDLEAFLATHQTG